MKNQTVKADAGKPRLSLVSPYLIEAVGTVVTCKYCENGVSLISNQNGCTDIEVWIEDGNTLIGEAGGMFEVSLDKLKINYCPMCGKKLEVEAENE